MHNIPVARRPSAIFAALPVVVIAWLLGLGGGSGGRFAPKDSQPRFRVLGLALLQAFLAALRLKTGLNGKRTG
jgi:hypothetical protein